MQKTIHFLCFVFVAWGSCLPAMIQAGTQQNPLTITGTVSDAAGEAIIGASVILKGTAQGTATDIDGNFSLNVDAKTANPEIQISYVGFKPVTVKASGNAPLKIVLEEDSKLMEEVVVVGYGTQKRATMSSAVAQVKGEQLAVLQAPRLSTSIGGMVSGVITFQKSGAPGSDNADIYVRGNTPLILVDGVERPYDRVNKEDIESISVLKDAAAVAPYGLKGANGVILITTKRGSEKTTAIYNGEVSWQKPMNTPDFLSSADYFDLLNKAYDMEGTPGQKRSEDEIALYRSGENPDRYPNTDWAGNYMKTSPATKHNISVSAGNEKIKAFASLGYVYQGSMFDGQDYRRYTARANMDIQATKTTKISVDNSFTKDILARTGLGADQIMERIYFAVPYEVDRFSNGKSAFQQSLGTSLYEAMYNRGYYKENNDVTTTNITIDQQFPFLKGLSGKAAFNYDKQHKDAKTWTLPLTYYNIGMDAEGKDTFEKVEQTVKPSLGQEYKRWDWYTFNGSLNWKNNSGKHHFDALALFEARWTEASVMTGNKSEFNFLIPELDFGTSEKDKWSLGGSSSSTAQCGVVGRINYDFDQKYLLEIAGRYDATYFYRPGKRTDFFPSVSIGWRISEEPFMAFSRNIVDNLKIRASYGKSGWVTGNEFAYMNYYKIGAASYVWGTGDTQTREQGLYAEMEANPELTWQRIWKTNLGFDLNMWNGLLGLEADYYQERRTNKVIDPSAVTPYEYGIPLAQENAGIDFRQGIDISLNNKTKITPYFTLQNTAVFTFTRFQQIEIHENPGSLYNPRKRQTGLPGSQIWGYRSAGLFKDMEDIQNSAFQDSGTLPGDVKYEDINRDGKIDGEDVVHIGLSQVPEIMFGYNLRASWKGFDAGLFIQGTGRSNYLLSSADKGVIHPFARNKARTEHLQSWTTGNPDPNAAYPRLRSAQFAMNYAASDFWLVNSSYIKLKSIDLGYNITAAWLKKAGMERLRIYANFYNVWTIFSETSKDFDPESQSYSAYPQQFISTIGLTATF